MGSVFREHTRMLSLAVVLLMSVATSLAADCYVGVGLDYHGILNHTKSGTACMSWDSDEPHIRNPAYYQRYKDYHNNFCRNPDTGYGNLWCYTTDPKKRWEDCGVPKCETDRTVDLKCWRNKIPQALTRLEGTNHILDKQNYKKRVDALTKCQVAAQEGGYDFFAVGNHGQCWGGHGEDYKKYGKVEKCPKDGMGFYGTTNVYEIIATHVCGTGKCETRSHYCVKGECEKLREKGTFCSSDRQCLSQDCSWLFKCK